MGVRLWDPEARAWGESSLEVPVGQTISGKLTFKVGAANKVREFDTGLVLVSVRTATRFESEKVKEPLMESKTDANGETVSVVALDAAKQPRWVEKVVLRRSPTQVAVLREGNTEKMRLIKGMGYEEKLPPGVRILLEGEAEPNIEQILKTNR
jgi:ribulose bisphosphate carboxylase small subunit